MNLKPLNIKQLLELKRGDKLVCIDDSNKQQIQNGKTYLFSWSSGNCLYLIEPSGIGYYNNRFAIQKKVRIG